GPRPLPEGEREGAPPRRAEPAGGAGSPPPTVGRVEPEPAPAAKHPEAPAPAAPPSPGRQVAQGVRVALARGGDRVTVQLEPAHLGKVHLVLTREEGGVAAQFRVETPQAQQALTGDLPALRQALEAKGLNLVHAWVDLAHDRSGGREEGQRPSHHRRRAARVAPVGDGEGRPEPGPWRGRGFEARV
ncbi:MAG: flagellar hook-length control protein FliK, partial [Deferrisomatales bacterium]